MQGSKAHTEEKNTLKNGRISGLGHGIYHNCVPCVQMRKRNVVAVKTRAW